MTTNMTGAKKWNQKINQTSYLRSKVHQPLSKSQSFSTEKFRKPSSVQHHDFFSELSNVPSKNEGSDENILEALHFFHQHFKITPQQGQTASIAWKKTKATGFLNFESDPSPIKNRQGHFRNISYDCNKLALPNKSLSQTSPSNCTQEVMKYKPQTWYPLSQETSLRNFTIAKAISFYQKVFMSSIFITEKQQKQQGNGYPINHRVIEIENVGLIQLSEQWNGCQVKVSIPQKLNSNTKNNISVNNKSVEGDCSKNPFTQECQTTISSEHKNQHSRHSFFSTNFIAKSPPPKRLQKSQFLHQHNTLHNKTSFKEEYQPNQKLQSQQRSNTACKIVKNFAELNLNHSLVQSMFDENDTSTYSQVIDRVPFCSEQQIEILTTNHLGNPISMDCYSYSYPETPHFKKLIPRDLLTQGGISSGLTCSFRESFTEEQGEEEKGEELKGWEKQAQKGVEKHNEVFECKMKLIRGFFNTKPQAMNKPTQNKSGC